MKVIFSDEEKDNKFTIEETKEGKILISFCSVFDRDIWEVDDFLIEIAKEEFLRLSRDFISKGEAVIKEMEIKTKIGDDVSILFIPCAERHFHLTLSKEKGAGFIRALRKIV